jgi:6-pyruvoyltetrahydropterin/6-carboxytetrahydropterin synthase
MNAYLGRRYRFCASHRLFRPEWDELRNREAFGKCANPHGHGHNYTVEVLVGGAVDDVSGMVMDLVELDALVEREVIEPFDHSNLNCLPLFGKTIPISENVFIAIYERLERALPRGTVLTRVGVEETPNNSFTYAGRSAEMASRRVENR